MHNITRSTHTDAQAWPGALPANRSSLGIFAENFSHAFVERFEMTGDIALAANFHLQYEGATWGGAVRRRLGAPRTSRGVAVAGGLAETLDWWENHRSCYQVFIPVLVELEIDRGDPDQARRRREIVEIIESVAVSLAAVAVSDALL